MKDIEKQQRISTILFVIVTAIFFIAMCTGCSTTVPVTAKFPEVSARLMEKCPTLQKLKEDAKLSDVSKTITVNYTTYYECAVKHDAFIEWYQVQKNIYESVK
jgi:uncharacterized lipoprotein YajG